jgi:hypothetical protein
MIIMLIVSIVSFLTLVFNYVDVQMPDLQDWRMGQLSAIRGSIASLVIVWPVTMFMAWLIGKDLKKEKEKQGIWVRKWLLHLMLFLSAITIIIDLVTLVGTFLDGELTLRFVLKVLSVLIVAGVVFWYELRELKRDITKPTKRPLAVAIGGSVAVLAMVVAGFFVIGSPAEQRQLKYDQVRVDDLANIQAEIVEYAVEESMVPESLTELEGRPGFELPMDPETEEAYTYNKTGDMTYELCAMFGQESDEDQYFGRPHVFIGDGGIYEEVFNDWTHSGGYYCFEREILASWLDEGEKEE